MRPSKFYVIAAMSGLSLLGAAGGHWVAALRNVGPPRGIEVLGPCRVEAGPWDRERPFEHAFLLRNPTRAPIGIRGVRTRCTCTTAEQAGRVVGPGQTTSLTVVVQSFDPERDRFEEPATIETDAGPVEVRLSGDLPPSGKVFVRPTVLYVEAGGGRGAAEHEVRLRVPKRCAGEISGRAAEVLGFAGAELRLAGHRPDGLYEEYALRLKLPAPGAGGGTGGSLRVVTGCETVTVPIVVHSVNP